MTDLVLYIEDELNDVFFMNYAWEKAGIGNPLRIIENGQQAINYLAGSGRFADRKKYPLPCLLLLDLKLPIKSGFEVLRWIRQHPVLNGLRVVVLSGSEQDPDIAMAQSLGITDYLVKPSSPIHLIQLVRRLEALWLSPHAEVHAKS